MVEPHYELADQYKNFSEYEKAYEHEKAAEITKYTMSGYIRYVAFLDSTMKYYYNNNDFEKTHLYIDRILEAENQINIALSKTNPLTYKTIHKPRLDIPERMKSFFA